MFSKKQNLNWWWTGNKPPGWKTLTQIIGKQSDYPIICRYTTLWYCSDELNTLTDFIMHKKQWFIADTIDTIIVSIILGILEYK